jgi:hypothetical protein
MTAKELEYRGRKLIARQYANGWQIEIRPLQAGPIKQTAIFRELDEAINAAKKIVTNLAVSDWTESVSIHGTDGAMLLRARK